MTVHRRPRAALGRCPQVRDDRRRWRHGSSHRSPIATYSRCPNSGDEEGSAMRPATVVLAVTILAAGACSQHHRPLLVRASASLIATSAPRELRGPDPTTTATTAPVPPVTVPKAVATTWPKAPRIASVGTGRCGGDLPPCSVMYCENGGKVTGTGPMTRAGTAKGKWQIMDGTWANGRGGYRASDGQVYRTANDAPESIQDERARQIYAGGAGRSQWSC